MFCLFLNSLIYFSVACHSTCLYCIMLQASVTSHGLTSTKPKLVSTVISNHNHLLMVTATWFCAPCTNRFTVSSRAWMDRISSVFVGVSQLKRFCFWTNQRLVEHPSASGSRGTSLLSPRPSHNSWKPRFYRQVQHLCDPSGFPSWKFGKKNNLYVYRNKVGAGNYIRFLHSKLLMGLLLA